MKRILILIHSLFAALVCAQAAIAAPIQQIYVVNTLWNPNATAAAPGMTQTAVVVAFNNGGSKPCFTTTLAFDGSITVSAGTGLACVAKITSVTVTPIAGPAGAVFATPADTNITSSYFSSQLAATDGTDPVFDTTNGNIKTQGVVTVTMEGS